MNNRKTGVILSYILMILEVLSTLLLTPFIIRTMGQSEYGVYKLTVSINAYLLLLDLGVGNSVIRYLAKYRAAKAHEDARKFLGVAMLYYLAIGILTLAAGAVLTAVFPHVFSNGLNDQEILLGQKLLGITMVTSAVTMGSAAFSNAVIAYERFKISKGASIIQILIRMGLTWIVLRCGMGSLGIVTINLVLTVLCKGFFVFYVLFCIKLRPRLRGIETAMIKDVVAYSSFILIQMIATQLNATLDQILIGALTASSAVILAVYGVGAQIVQYFQSIGSAFNGVLMPGVVALVERRPTGETLTNEMVRIGRLVFMVLGLIWSGFLVLGQQFVTLWAGSVNDDAYYVALILMAVYTFILTQAIGGQILWAMNQHREQAVLKFGIVVFNIVATVLLIRWNPLFGATIGTFLSLLLGDVGVLNFILVKKLRIRITSYYAGLFRGILPCLIVAVAVGLAVRFAVPAGWLGLILNAGVMCGVYALAMILRGLNGYEKKLFYGMLFSRRYKKE